MLNLEEFKKMEPKSIQETLELEPFSEVMPRLKLALPNFPLCVLEQWTYRHFIDFCYKYWWLNYDELYFEKVMFDTNKIMEIKTDFLGTQDYWGDDFINNPGFRAEKTWLGAYMNKEKTWPKPIIVFDTQANKYPLEEELFMPYHLLEGHMRLAYMRALIRHKIEGVSEFHEVWLVHKK